MHIPTKYKGRTLHLDIENSPLTYYAPDYPTAQITAICSAWADDVEGTIHTCLLGECDPREMLGFISKRWDEATLVSGHYARAHDFPIINAGLVEFGMTTLAEKMTSDTKLDLVKFRTLPKNQEYLGALLGTDQKKIPVSQYEWREANRLTPEGRSITKERVEADVRQHVQMRAGLIERGLLKPPKMWTP